MNEADQHQETLARIHTLIHDRLPPTEAPLVATFVTGFLRGLPAADLAAREPESLYGLGVSLWRFVQQRRQSRVRVYTPDLAQHGWQGGQTVVEIVTDDQPFLVDSVTGYFAANDITVHDVIHPLFLVARDGAGHVTELFPADANAPADLSRESVMHLAVAAQPSGPVLEAIARDLHGVLADVTAAVEDWQAVLSRLDMVVALLEHPPAVLDTDAAAEARDFLRWLRNDHFAFLGHRTFDLPEGLEGPAVVGDGLGLLRNPTLRLFPELGHPHTLPAEGRALLAQPGPLFVTKSETRATVHRRVPYDLVVVRRFDAEGTLAGLTLFAGLFTASVYNTSPRFVPLLRRRLERVLDATSVPPAGHDAKRLMNILETHPRDELFQCDEDTLLQTARGILHLQERGRTAVFVRHDPFQRFVSCLVFVPRDRYNTDRRLAVQEILEQRFQGTVTAFYTQVSDSPLARMQFIIDTTPGQLPAVDGVALERQVADAVRAWADLLQAALITHTGEERGLRLFRRYRKAFPAGYRERFGAQVAVADIENIEHALITGRAGTYLYRPLEAADTLVRLKVYHPDSPLPLSDMLPILENMGFRVVGEEPYPLRIAPQPHAGNGLDTGAFRRLWIHDFEMVSANETPLDLAAVRTPLYEALARVWDGAMENDGFNRLVVLAQLAWRDIVVLRAYCRFLRQGAFTFSQAYMADTLAANPELARLLVDLFHARFDPDQVDGERADSVTAEFLAGLETVANVDEDRILRRFLDLIQATRRTNAFQTDDQGQGRPYLALKLDSGAIPDLPQPRPWRETFVYAPWMEGVHLRGGAVARGGIRWSDRREDFRTEILGLMKAQMVKNAVIVPVGAKGGFVLKTPPARREDLQAEAVRCYQTLIRGLLDLADNLDADGVVPPPRVVRHDGDDPYLVVAADKGTATFSDLANALSLEYGYWLGDAFASGGSHGYDHKGMGITARGAWESVKRHFRERGHDVMTQPFTVAGVGDMAGDVFGNGMLYTDRLRLVAAFNHQHIFLDPDPDPDASFRERRRLFETPRTTWADYDPALLSSGGAVFERRAKSVTLSPEAQALLGLEAATVSPAAVLRAILTLDVDLLWFGGIGTYVKAAAENNAEVDDRANDALRVDAEALRCRVIGEGANLGVTQRGRIAFALAGGALNTDSVDNAAGVTCSDHEVNIKILLDQRVRDGDLTTKQRNALLTRMTDEVGALVLKNNYLTTQAISLMVARGPSLVDHQQRLMRLLERAGRLDRRLEFLPDDETLAERITHRQGLSRPEIAVLMAYAKIWLYDHILDSNLPDDEVLAGDLQRYFPAPLQRDHAAAIAHHRLRREIIATHVTNSLVNRVGGTFVTQIMEKTGVPPAEVARAYIAARDSFALRELWECIEGLDGRVSPEVQLAMRLETNRLIDRATQWFLRHEERPLAVGETVAAFRPAIEALTDCIDDVMGEAPRDSVARRTRGYTDQGVPPGIATRVAQSILLASACDIVRITRHRGLPVEETARVYFRVGERFQVGHLRALAQPLAEGGSHWQKLAVAAVLEDLYRHQRDITWRVLTADDTRVLPTAHVLDEWIPTRQLEVERTDQVLAEILAYDKVDLAQVMVGSRQLRTLLGD